MNGLAKRIAAVAAPLLLMAAVPAEGRRPWTMNDIIEVSRIVGTAVDGQGRRGAYLARDRSVARGGDLYSLFLIPIDRKAPPRKLLVAPFAADLHWDRHDNGWSLRADLGAGVQLYSVGDDGRVRPLVINPEPAPVGGSDGLVASAGEGKRPTGILAYGWSPDGDTFWYTRLRLATPRQRAERHDNGILYNDLKLVPSDFYADAPADALELHVVTMRQRRDRIVASVPGDRYSTLFGFDAATVGWTGAGALVFNRILYGPDGKPSSHFGTFDVATGATKLLANPAGQSLYLGAAGSSGLLVVRRQDDGTQHLIELEPAGEHDLGPVPFSSIGDAGGAWHGPAGRSLYAVRLPDREGLVELPGPRLGLTSYEGNISACSFDAALDVGLCSTETVSKAPELAIVRPEAGSVEIAARPNARYDDIEPLRTEPASWTNAHGGRTSGYVTYPRGFEEGRRYPTVIVTHASDAKNRFAEPGFQWAFPLQVLAERGFIVLSVNERPSDEAVSRAYASFSSDLPVERMQRGMGLEAVSTMEGAARWAIDQGLADPGRLGIIGYSRGGIVTQLTLSQSRMFRVGINADTAFFNAGEYFHGAEMRALYTALFGGSPLDARYAPNYRAFSPSARPEHFSGPLLQLFTATNAPSAIELHEALRSVGVPAELVGYPDETHVFHAPRAIRSAMVRSLDWLDFWLRGIVDPDPSKVARFARWNAMRAQWQLHPPLGASTSARDPLDGGAAALGSALALPSSACPAPAVRD